MKLRSLLFTAIAALWCTAGFAAADEAGQSNFVVFPIKTDLQRELLSSRADAYLQFDVAACAPDRKFDPKRLDRKGLQRRLSGIARQMGKKEPRLFVAYRYSDGYLDGPQQDALEKAIRGLCREAGFISGGTSMSGDGTSWQDKLARFYGLDDDASAAETPLENEFVRVYPVHTTLSRFVLGRADCDCYMVLRRPIERTFKDFSLEERLAMSQLISQLNLSHRDCLIVYHMVTTPGRATSERYFQRNGAKWESTADRFVRKLGFRSCGSVMCPMTVSPEELLGKPAPDFTIDTLDGRPLHLQENIRGKVAVIAFWGVACGPCCREAPHLSALYERYKEKGLTVIAVNAYNETRPVVEGFVLEKRLSHLIGLMGGSIAQQYTVASYPVVWFVDHSGNIADYHLGFDPGDEVLLDKSIARLLAERTKANAGK
jgi:thiol-disulfide isomerase/thioredoxin